MPKAIPYQRGSIMFFEGDKDDRIFILQTGQIILTSQDIESGANIVEQIHTGEFFGVKSALAHMPRMETATVIADSQVIVMTVAEFEKIFCNNQAIMMKMLKVFSSKLRELHKKTEAILNNKQRTSLPEVDMLSVAQDFLNDGQYHSAESECKRILEKFPECSNKSAVESLLQDASIKAKDETPFIIDSEQLAQRNSNTAVSLKQFSSPAFERFSKSYESGDVIISEYEPGNLFYVIQEGDIQLLKNINGTHKTIDILHAGEFFGEMAILDNSPRSATCIARGPAKCLVFDKSNFSALVTGNPQMVMVLLKLFCKRIYDQRRMFKILVIKDKNIRVADVFCMYEELTVDGSKGDPSNQMRKFYLNYSDIAHWAGITLDECHAEVKTYIDRHKIEVFDNYIMVKNIADMKRIVDAYNAVRK